jgi:hypothetical protein
MSVVGWRRMGKLSLYVRGWLGMEKGKGDKECLRREELEKGVDRVRKREIRGGIRGGGLNG